jgi:hemerythrin superfamily protein
MADKDTTDMKVDVEVLKTQVSTLTNLCEKMDKVIEKLVDHQSIIINQIYDDMDRRKQSSDNDIKDLYNKVNSLSKELSERIEKSEDKLMEKMAQVYERISKHADSEEKVIDVIQKYKWPFVIGVVVISWLTSHVGPDTILKLIAMK